MSKNNLKTKPESKSQLTPEEKAIAKAEKKAKRIEDQKKMIKVLIVEDDPYAADQNLLQLCRDTRTKLVGELSSHIDVQNFVSLKDLRKAKQMPDTITPYNYFNISADQDPQVVILDTEVPRNQSFAIKVIQRINTWENAPKVICTCTYPDLDMFYELNKCDCFYGYLVKGEILYSMASAVCLAHKGKFVVTPSVIKICIDELPYKKAENTLVLSSPKLLPPQTEDKKLQKNAKNKMDVIRLSILFNLPIAEIEDELDYKSAGREITKKYTELKIPELIYKTETLENLFNNKGFDYIDNTKIIEYFQETLKDIHKVLERRKNDKKQPKFRGVGTLAYHLHTRVIIQSLNEVLGPGFFYSDI